MVITDESNPLLIIENSLCALPQTVTDQSCDSMYLKHLCPTAGHVLEHHNAAERGAQQDVQQPARKTMARHESRGWCKGEINALLEPIKWNYSVSDLSDHCLDLFPQNHNIHASQITTNNL